MTTPTTFEQWQTLAKNLQPETRAFINGEYQSAQSEKTFTRISPIDNQPLAEVARCDKADIDAAVACARKAFDQGVWKNQEPSERKQVLLRWAELIRENVQTLALLETLEVGKPIGDTQAVDVPGCANAISYYAEFADKLYDEIAPTGPHDQALIKRMPLGVIGAIVPWNYPLIIAGWKIGPALVLGNSVVLKPAEQSSLASIHLAKLAKEAGIPDGVFNVVPGLGEEAGKALSEHDDVDLIAFTGSTSVGRLIMETAAKTNLKRVALELGGKSPQIVMDDCDDLDAAASAIAWGIFYNAGQTCHAGSRLIVHKNIAQTLYEKVVEVANSLKQGHPLDPTTQIGVMVEAEHKAKVLEYIALGTQEGATLTLDGRQPDIDGAASDHGFIGPTLLTNASPDARISKEEIFGPVLVTTEIESEEEAIAIANDTDFGLAAAVWTSNIKCAHRMSEALRAGTVWINTYDRASMATPFGGFQQSGFGRDRSIHALDKYADLKTVWTHFG
ncbi:aldehyde dehydrogenase family protein [Marinibactrum halimedae]|uniref:Aldehyde dehydrogenase n=1 Tax=Marinibactrum halimedae TaxID=1444977 RepID=A0AA37T2Q4_9GAMM|nr:aldehyde dehydrogenase family protein [Marinibactrum halimedae]MCD9458156.1 aldehyde dehydrogenase family protein [Marinibactrum halimedae]GLS25089.1 aldehyde dehydrogenase [Marinibactrum halimedae]